MSTSTAKRKKLATYSIRPNWWVRVRPWLIGLVITGIVLGLIYWIWQPAATSQGTPSPEQTRIKDVIQILILILGFVFGYVQWIMARYEASLDRFYDRLDVANRRLGTMVEQAWNRANPVDMAGFDVYANPPRVGVGLFDMWVFAELDNLEYIIEKYKWGFITAAQACRALNTFRSRCEHDNTFVERALKFSKESAFSKTTCKVVEKIQRELISART